MLSPLLNSKFLKKTEGITASCPHPATCREGDQEGKMFSHRRRSVFESHRSCLKSTLCDPEGVNTAVWKTGIMSPQRVVLSIPRSWAFTIGVTGECQLSPWYLKKINACLFLTERVNTCA